MDCHRCSGRSAHFFNSCFLVLTILLMSSVFVPLGLMPSASHIASSSAFLFLRRFCRVSSESLTDDGPFPPTTSIFGGAPGPDCGSGSLAAGLMDAALFRFHAASLN